MRLKFLGLATIVLVLLAACGQMTAPETVQQEEFRALSELGHQALTVGSSTTPLSLKASTCASGSSQSLTITFSVTGNQGRTATFDVNSRWVYNGTSWSASSPRTITVPPQSGGTTTTYEVEITAENASTTGTGTGGFTVVPFNLSTAAPGALTVDSRSRVNVQVAFADCPVVNTRPTLVLPSSALVYEATSGAGADVGTFPVTANDSEDGTLTDEVECLPAAGSTFPLGSTTVNCSVTDSGGLSASGSFSVTVVDTTPPDIAWNGDIGNGDSYYFGSVPSLPTCTATDLVDPNPVCTVSGYGAGVGNHRLTATARDSAGNTASQDVSYSVLAWTISGFQAPVDMGISNNAKGGATVPLKFEVFAGTTELTDTGVVQALTRRINCDASASSDDIEQYSTSASGLRYDLGSGQFIFNWKTPKDRNCYRVTLETMDGSSIFANFTMK